MDLYFLQIFLFMDIFIRYNQESQLDLLNHQDLVLIIFILDNTIDKFLEKYEVESYH